MTTENEINGQYDRITQMLRQEAAAPIDYNQSAILNMTNPEGYQGQIQQAGERKQQAEMGVLQMFEAKKARGDKQAQALDDKINLFTGGDPEGTALILEQLHADPEQIDPGNAYQVMTKIAGIVKKSGYVSPAQQEQKLNMRIKQQQLANSQKGPAKPENQKELEYYDSLAPDQQAQYRLLNNISEPLSPGGVTSHGMENPGVPEAAPDPFFGVRGKSKDALVNNVRQNAIKQIDRKDVLEQVNAATPLKSRMERFQELLNVQDTGGAMINTPGVGALMQKFDPELNEMRSIQSELAPKMRVPGSGSSSDTDVKMFKEATIDPKKPKQTNQNIANAFIAAQQNILDHDQFKRDYLDYHGHIQGAEQAWRGYLENNPIFKAGTKPENPELNPDRLDYRQYFQIKNTGQQPEIPALEDPLGIR